MYKIDYQHRSQVTVIEKLKLVACALLAMSIPTLFQTMTHVNF